MMKFLILFSLIFTGSLSWATTTREDAIARRIDAYSFQFMGKPYISGALGEAFGMDADPLFRFDGFDCTTFVETVSALALAQNGDEFQKMILKIRYKNGFVDFKTRNHFTSVDWIPNNVSQGLIVERTEQLFPIEFAFTKTLIDKKSWFLQNYQVDDNSIPMIAELAYLPLTTINENPEILERIPSGSLINIVRINWGLKDKIGTDLDVSHQGFVIRKNDGVLYFRHASNEKKFVTEEPLAQYLARMGSIKSIGGINILGLR